VSSRRNRRPRRHCIRVPNVTCDATVSTNVGRSPQSHRRCFQWRLTVAANSISNVVLCIEFAERQRCVVTVQLLTSFSATCCSVAFNKPRAGFVSKDLSVVLLCPPTSGSVLLRKWLSCPRLSDSIALSPRNILLAKPALCKYLCVLLRTTAVLTADQFYSLNCDRNSIDTTVRHALILNLFTSPLQV
jgi:hypothetical protein